MKSSAMMGMVTAAMVVASTASGWAMTQPGAATAGLYTCNGRSLSRVALTVPAEQPAPCCTGMTGCPQLLANTGLVKPRRDNRT